MDGERKLRRRGMPERQTRKDVRRVAEGIARAHPNYSMAKKFRIANAAVTKRKMGRRGR